MPETTQQTPAPKNPASPRRTMIYAIVVLAVSQCLPFGSNEAFMRDRVNGDNDALAGVDYNKYSAHPAQHIDGGGLRWGLTEHTGAWVMLIALAIVFFSSLYRRPAWIGKVYWVALILSFFTCFEVPPPIFTLGGAVCTLSLAMMAYAAFKNLQITNP